MLNISVGWDKIRTLECKYRYMQIKAKGEFIIGMCLLMQVDSGWPCAGLYSVGRNNSLRTLNNSVMKISLFLEEQI